jgi:uncharacterized protein YjiS (DUF1127 family)
MEGTSSLYAQRVQPLAGYALVEVIAELAVGACRFIARLGAAFMKARRQERARAELQNLSDHFLKDIGLDRQQVDRLFR